MTEPTKRKNSRLRKILIAVFILLLILAGIYWFVSTEKFSDTSERKAAFTVTAINFIHEFQQNASAANTRYTDKIITVSGTVSEIEAADTTVNIKFIDTVSGSYAIFAFQEQHLAEAKALKTGDAVSIKGSCSGGIHSDILGTEAITFKRCALAK